MKQSAALNGLSSLGSDSASSRMAAFFFLTHFLHSSCIAAFHVNNLFIHKQACIHGKRVNTVLSDGALDTWALNSRHLPIQ